MREASGVAAGLVALPSGGGGIAPLGDRFQPDLVRGSGSYAVPLTCPKGPNDLQPALSLTYSHRLRQRAVRPRLAAGLLRIERRTDRGVPHYSDADQFVLGDAEVLVAGRRESLPHRRPRPASGASSGSATAGGCAPATAGPCSLARPTPAASATGRARVRLVPR